MTNTEYPKVTVGTQNVRVILHEGGEEIVFSKTNYDVPSYMNCFTRVQIDDDKLCLIENSSASFPKDHLTYAKLLSESRSDWLSRAANVTRLNEEFIDDEFFPFTFIQLQSHQCPHEEFANCFAFEDIAQWKQTIAHSHAIINTAPLLTDTDGFSYTTNNLILRDHGVLLVLRCQNRVFNEKFLYNTTELDCYLPKSRRESLRSHPVGTGQSVGRRGSNGEGLVFVIPEVSATKPNGDIDEDSVVRIVENEIAIRRRGKLKYRLKILVSDFNVYAKSVTNKLASQSSESGDTALRAYVDSEFEHVKAIEQILTGLASQKLLDQLSEFKGEQTAKSALLEAVKALSVSVERMNEQVESVLEEQDAEDFDQDIFDEEVDRDPQEEDKPKQPEFSLFEALTDWSRESQERERNERMEKDRRDQEFNDGLRRQRESEQRHCEDDVRRRAEESRRKEEEQLARRKEQKENADYERREKSLEIVYTMRGGGTQVVGSGGSPAGARNAAEARLRSSSSTVGYVIRNKNGVVISSG